METEVEVFKKLQAIAKDIELTYKIKDEELASEKPMNIDSLEFMSLIIEVQSRFSVTISDEEVQQKNLRVLKNLVSYLNGAQPGSGQR